MEHAADDVCLAFLLEHDLFVNGWEHEFEGEVSGLVSGGAFVSFAPAYKPEISVIALIENSGFGAANAAPAAKAIYEAYLLKRPPEKGMEQTIAAK